jgi:site-specific DNA recombinase
MTRAALYARLSRDRSGEETATARQLQDCRAFATARGWEIAADRRLRGMVLGVGRLDR